VSSWSLARRSIPRLPSLGLVNGFAFASKLGACEQSRPGSPKNNLIFGGVASSRGFPIFARVSLFARLRDSGGSAMLRSF